MLEDLDRRKNDTKAHDMEGNNSQGDQNQRKAVVAGFHDDTTAQEVQDTLKEIITTIGMSTDQIQIKCPAKPIKHAFLQFTDNDERDKFVTTANILKKEVRGRKIKISPAMDAEEKHQKRLGYLECCIHTRHSVPLVQIKINRSTRHVSVDGQIVIRTCANGSLKYHKNQDIEAEVETTMEQWMTKKLVATNVSIQEARIRRRMEGMTMRSHQETKTCREQEKRKCEGKRRVQTGSQTH